MAEFGSTNRFYSDIVALDGGDDDLIVTATSLVANGSKDDYTIASNPTYAVSDYAVGRGLTFTLVDADSSGLSVDVTVTGTGLNGKALVKTYTGATGAAGGTIYFLDGFFKTVTQLATETTGFGSGDTIRLGQGAAVFQFPGARVGGLRFEVTAGTNAANIAFGETPAFTLGDADAGNFKDQLVLESGDSRSLDEHSLKRNMFSAIADVLGAAGSTVTLLFELVGWDPEA